MPQSEKDITNAILRYLKREGAWARKIHGSLYTAGLPDIVACAPVTLQADDAAAWIGPLKLGAFLGLEVKRPGNKPTPLQQATLDGIIGAAGIGAVVTSVEEAQEALSGLG